MILVLCWCTQVCPPIRGDSNPDFPAFRQLYMDCACVYASLWTRTRRWRTRAVTAMYALALIDGKVWRREGPKANR